MSRMHLRVVTLLRLDKRVLAANPHEEGRHDEQVQIWVDERKLRHNQHCSDDGDARG